MSLTNLTVLAVAGDANADFVVSSDHQRRVLYGHVNLTTDATVANRRVIARVLDDTGTPVTVFDTHAGAVVVASQAGQHHEMMQGIFRETAFIGGALQVPIPKDMMLLPDWTLRVLIDAGVNGDSFDVQWVVEDNHLGAVVGH